MLFDCVSVVMCVVCVPLNVSVWVMSVKGFVVTANDSSDHHTEPFDGPITFKCVWFHVPWSA